MQVGDLVRLRCLHNVLGLVTKVRPYSFREDVCFVKWHTIHQSHGHRWFDESDLEVLKVPAPIAYSADPV